MKPKTRNDHDKMTSDAENWQKEAYRRARLLIENSYYGLGVVPNCWMLEKMKRSEYNKENEKEKRHEH